jgi:DNA-binding beta-propeller fold protein YncE
MHIAARRLGLMPRVLPHSGGVAVSVDGSTLLVADGGGKSFALHEITADASRLRVVGGKGKRPLQFGGVLHQVWIDADGFVFVVDAGNKRVQVLTPTLDFHGFVGLGVLDAPAGVCANSDVIVVSEKYAGRITVFTRADGTRRRMFGLMPQQPNRYAIRWRDSELSFPLGLCFMSGDSRVAVADYVASRITVFGIDGEFIRHVGEGVLSCPHGAACTAFDELIVADSDRVVLFGPSGSMLATFGSACFTGIAMHPGRGVVFAVASDSSAGCDVLQLEFTSSCE